MKFEALCRTDAIKIAHKIIDFEKKLVSQEKRCFKKTQNFGPGKYYYHFCKQSCQCCKDKFGENLQLFM